MLTLSFVTGTEPGKWFDRYRERTNHGGLDAIGSDDAMGELIDARASLALVRLPDSRINDSFHVVELYQESLGIALPKDSELTLLDELTSSDISEEIITYEISESGRVDIAALREALSVVAANVGVAIAPRPLLKVLSKKQIEHRAFSPLFPVETFIAVVWRKDDDCDAIQDFVGIARGRTPQSSRQSTPKKTAREKTLAKQARRGVRPRRPAPGKSGRNKKRR